MLEPLKGMPHAAYIATPDDRNSVGATAMLCLSVLDSHRSDKYAGELSALVAGLAAMQKEDGSFRTCFPPASVESSQDYAPGETLLAIARYYAGQRDAHLREVCDRALPFYQRYFREHPSAPFIPWQTAAWGQLARVTQLRKYADFAFELSDALLPSQIDGKSGDEAIFNGGFDVHGGGRAGIATAVYIEGLVDAVQTARAFGETQRAARYVQAIRKGCRFVLQLRFKPEEAFYVQSPQDVLGAVRDTPSDPSLRIDHNQHALCALLGAAEVALATQPASN